MSDLTVAFIYKVKGLWNTNSFFEMLRDMHQLHINKNNNSTHAYY